MDGLSSCSQCLCEWQRLCGLPTAGRERILGLRPRAVSLLLRRARQHHSHQAASLLETIRNLDPSSVRLGNLPREDEPNSAAAGLCRVERREDICGIQETGAIVFDKEMNILIGDIPSHANLSICI